MLLNRNTAFRAAAHVVTWIPFICGTAILIHGGWRPVSDDAGIAVRAWDGLSTYGPLVGQPSRLAPGVYDPGPLEYWLLTLPVHLDPPRGLLWGGALWCIVACSLTVEAAWAVAGKLGAAVASATILAALLWIPALVIEPCWNPWFGLMFFLAAFSAGWAVMSGHLWWWPAAMVTASIAAQAHLMYALTAAALVLVAFIVGLVDSIRARRGHRWALSGVVAGIACWIGPIIQQFTARQGNLTALIESQGRGGPKGGAVFGLKTLAASVQIPPAWWTRLDLLPGLGWIEERSAAAGVIVLVLTVAALVVAVRPLRSRPAAMLAAVSLVASAATLVTFSDIPTLSINVRSTSVNSLNYLMAPMLAVGVLAWLAVGSVLVLGGTRILRMAYARRAMPGDRDTGPAPAVGAAWARWAVPAGAVTAAALVTLASFASFGAAKVRHTGSEMLNDSIVSIVGVASRKIEARLPHQLISLRFQGGDKHYRRRLAFGLVYALQSAGYRTEVMANYAWQLGPTYAFEPTHKVRVTVTMAAGSGVSVSVKTFGHGQEAGVARVSHG